ncbi:hypothetical protein FA95DRAFT_1487052 [Auriscalpium vulgare]|uniref:Uncharacterized protein n=1 Tax=Auriscalpium vulgare TaxID=40419 RepID=A0ACB8S225_9AGAM|nr:hypothetical protein FA95DRAFT_1487052 [Auriscalpium vulgare]
MHLQTLSLSVLFLLRSARAHGHDEHSQEHLSDSAQYAQTHMATEHHIDSFDLPSFFQLHDLNRDGVWDSEEVEAIYGVHHVYSQKKSKDDEEHAAKAKLIVETIYKNMDKDGDGKITQAEFEAVGLDGLPSFENLGAEGHHYDVESEFFLHHEEQFHNTPETQSDDSYTHPEDLEHFAHHESIEHKEAEREAKYQGITVEEALAQHDEAPHDAPPPATEQHDTEHPDAPAEPHDTLAEPHDPVPEGAPPQNTPAVPGPKKYLRPVDPASVDPAVRFRDAKAESERLGDWGEGSAGYAPPKRPSERMRKNLPYKERMQYKFRRSWGDF